MSSVSFDLLIPASLWLTLALASALLLAWYALRRPPVVQPRRWALTVGLMGVGLLIVLLILLNPIWIREIDPPPGKPLITVLVDSSASMATPDAPSGSRYAAATDFARRVNERLGTKFEVRTWRFASAASATDSQQLAALEPVGESTNLTAALIASLDEQRPQGQAVVLLSDGIHNVTGPGEGGGAAAGAAAVLAATRLARAGATPIFTRTLGGSAGGQDLAVELRSAQD